MIWGIIGALEEEVLLILQKMTVKKTEEVYGATYYSGTIKSQRIVLVRCSVGTINAAACASVIIQRFGATAVVNVGIAGSACKELSVLDVVIGKDLLFHDADLDILEKYYPFRRSFPTDLSLRRLAEKAILEMGRDDLRYKVGRIASGDVFVADREQKEAIIQRCDPLCIEMEGAAIAQVSYMNRVPCLVIRTLSDNADENAEESYDNLINRAADISAHIILTMLELSN